MDSILYKFSYGLFVITTNHNNKDNGCIINTAIQVTENPDKIVAAINKNSLTYKMITESGKFNISIISENADFELFKHFGFQSGTNFEKFNNYNNAVRSKNGIYYITTGTNTYCSAELTEQIDLGTHTLLIADITETKILNNVNSATYEYYQKHIKPQTKKETSGYVCKVCGYVYHGDSIPDDFICPLCKHGISAFEKL